MEEIRNTTAEGNNIFYHDKYGMFRMTLYNTCPGVGFLSTVVVDEDHRKSGHGDRLLRFAEKKAQDYCLSCLTLQVEYDSWMYDWYIRRGYRVVAPGYDNGMVILSKANKHMA